MIGISQDAGDSHKKFCDDLKLPFDLLADTEKKAHEAFGHKAKARSLYLIDKSGKIVFANPKYDLKPESWQALLKAVEALEK